MFPVPIRMNGSAPAYLRGQYGVATGRLFHHDGSAPQADVIVRLENTDRLFAVHRTWLDQDRRHWKLLAKRAATSEAAPADLVLELTGARLDVLLKWVVDYAGAYERGVLFEYTGGRFKPVSHLGGDVSL